MALAIPSSPSNAKLPSLILNPVNSPASSSTIIARASMPPKLSMKPTPAPKASFSKPVVLAKDTSSSSGTVFAKPTKEWVIPDRAKPGRKVSEEEPDNKRQSQNRLSQRAHRARRTDYISTLEERIRQYEANEIHSNVRLQEVARALKADNERLKAELMSRKSSDPEEGWNKLRRDMEQEIASLRSEIVRLRGRIGSGDVGVLPTPTPRFWIETDSTLALAPSTRRGEGERLECPICPDPDPDCACQQARSSRSVPPAPSLAPAAEVALPTPHDHTCGLCQSHEECLCRVVSEEAQAVDVKPIITVSPKAALSPIATIHEDSCGLCTSAEFCACKITTTTSSPPNRKTVPLATSVAAVPLRSRPRNLAKTSIWAIVDPAPPPAPAAPRRGEAVCTGDPANCDACKNDSFGREFCSHLFAADAQKCARCSSKTSSTPAAKQVDHVHDDTMRPEQAWKAIKAHPNAKLASLALLADVVARRTITCSSTSSSEGDAEPLAEDAEAPASPSSKAVQEALDDVHGRKGKRKVMVESGAVREALRMLDEAGSKGHEGVERGRNAKRRKL